MKCFRWILSRLSNAGGERKTDCERNEAKRLCQTLSERYPRLPILLVEDALYANAPHLGQIIGYGWKYILTVKEDGHKSLFKQFAARRKTGQVKERVRIDAQGVEHYYALSNQLWMGEKAVDVKVNWLLYEQRTAGEEPKRWTWMTRLKVECRNG